MQLEKGTVAVITGGAQGLGFSIAKTLGNAGAKIVLLDYNEEGLVKAKEELVGLNIETLTIKCDVSKSGDVKESFHKIIDKYDRVDILVNNAAIAPDGNLLTTTEELWDKVLAINLKGYFLCAQTAAKIMIEKKIQGSIVNLSSTLGIRPKADLLAYTTTKGAIINFTGAIAAELGHFGIRVNAIAPGMIDTPMTQKGFVNPMVKNIVLSGIPLKRLGQPEEIGKAVLFLCSDYASFISGELLVVDGGQTGGMPSRTKGGPPKGMPRQDPSAGGHPASHGNHHG